MSIGVGNPPVLAFFHYEKFKFRSTDERVACFGRFFGGSFKNVPWVAFKALVLRSVNVAEQPAQKIFLSVAKAEPRRLSGQGIAPCLILQ